MYPILTVDYIGNKGITFKNALPAGWVSIFSRASDRSAETKTIVDQLYAYFQQNPTTILTCECLPVLQQIP